MLCCVTITHVYCIYHIKDTCISVNTYVKISALVIGGHPHDKTASALRHELLEHLGKVLAHLLERELDGFKFAMLQCLD